MEKLKPKSPQIKAVGLNKRSLSPCVNGTMKTNPEAQCGKGGNIFQNLSVFFGSNAPELAGTGSHVTMGTADDTVLLPILLCDITKRKFCLDKLIRDLDNYCKDKDGSNGRAQIFLSAVVKVLPSVETGGVIGEGSLGVLARLVYHISGALEDLVSLLCEGDNSCISETDSAWTNLRLLAMSLEHAQHCEAKTEHTKDFIPFVDRHFGFGESPLVFAARKRNFDVMSLLLSYGANITAKWMNFDNVLEVLLFAPQSVYLTADDILATVRCVSLACTALEGYNVISGLDEKDRTGYYALCPLWRELLPDHITKSQGPSLKHLSRSVIRHCLRENGSLPNGIKLLPIPPVVMEYIQLSL